jgi:hypothetical protein
LVSELEILRVSVLCIFFVIYLSRIIQEPIILSLHTYPSLNQDGREKLEKLKKPIQGMAPEVEAKFNVTNVEEFPKKVCLEN